MHYFEQYANEGYMNVISFKTFVLYMWTEPGLSLCCGCFVSGLLKRLYCEKKSKTEIYRCSSQRALYKSSILWHPRDASEKSQWLAQGTLCINITCTTYKEQDTWQAKSMLLLENHQNGVRQVLFVAGAYSVFTIKNVLVVLSILISGPVLLWRGVNCLLSKGFTLALLSIALFAICYRRSHNTLHTETQHWHCIH